MFPRLRLIALLGLFLSIAANFLRSAWAEPRTDNPKGYDTESFHNPVNNLYICVFTDSSGKYRKPTIVQLREAPSKQVIAAFSRDWRGIDALWSPDAAHVAVSYRDIKTGVVRTAVFTTTSKSLKAIGIPTSVSLRSLLAANDPAWKLAEYAESTEPVRWEDNRTLELEVRAVFRNPDSGYVNVTYKVVAKLAEDSSSLIIEASKQTEYSKSN
jgi:hypothetical protein